MPKKKPEVIKKSDVILEELKDRVDDLYELVEEQADLLTDSNAKLSEMTKSLSLMAKAVVASSNNMLKLSAGNVNVNNLRDLIFKRLNVKTGWAKAEIKGMINTIIGTLTGK